MPEPVGKVTTSVDRGRCHKHGMDRSSLTGGGVGCKACGFGNGWVDRALNVWPAEALRERVRKQILFAAAPQPRWNPGAGFYDNLMLGILDDPKAIIAICLRGWPSLHNGQPERGTTACTSRLASQGLPEQRQ